ncbi:MAG: hypothetical protein EP346_11170 [Bacteroidetes bacterium]|nr:MAG: hypothetical protein EP346_11170 [Bacteroidota bacterium]
MKAETIEILCCPFDKSDLKLTVVTQSLDREVLEGFFTCESCNRLYPIVQGIPIMNPDEYREGKLERPLLERWSKQLEAKDAAASRRLLETLDQ